MSDPARAIVRSWASVYLALGIVASLLPSAALAQDRPYDAQEPAPKAPPAGAPPEQRWGPEDTPDRSPDDDSDAWTKAGSPTGTPSRPAPSTAPDRRRRYSYEEDPRPDQKRVEPKKPKDGKSGRKDKDGEKIRDPEPEYPRLGVEAFMWIADYNGRVQRERNGDGTTFKPHDGGYNFDQVQPGLDVRIVFAPTDEWTLEAEYGIAYFTGDSELDDEIEFDGRYNAPGDRVKMAVQNEIIAFTAEYTFFARKHFRMGLPFGFAWLSQSVRLKNSTTGEDAQDRVDVVTPFLGLSIDIPITHGLGIDARARGFGFSAGDERDHISFGFFDFETRLYVTLGDSVRLYAGYRFLGVANEQRDEWDDSKGDFGINAFVAGLGVTF